jgi:peptidoglycan DL-endopeptidase CwlO
VPKTQSYHDRVTERSGELAAQLQDEQKLTADSKVAKQKVQDQLAANKKALAGKEAQIAQLEKDEAIRQARLAAAAREAARKAAAAEAARKKAAAAAASSKKSGGSSATGGGSSSVKVAVPSSASGSSVVSIAMQYLGTPYVWAGSSPSGFDCSGFVMYVYTKLGIHLPHSSRMQYPLGKAVSRSQLQPGDLVFFYNPIHHVGIYIGDGKMIDAAGTGKDVRIDSVDRSSYYGACRIIL